MPAPGVALAFSFLILDSRYLALFLLSPFGGRGALRSWGSGAELGGAFLRSGMRSARAGLRCGTRSALSMYRSGVLRPRGIFLTRRTGCVGARRRRRCSCRAAFRRAIRARTIVICGRTVICRRTVRAFRARRAAMRTGRRSERFCRTAVRRSVRRSTVLSRSVSGRPLRMSILGGMIRRRTILY